MTTKVLWAVTCEQNAVLAHAKRIGATAVAIRTDNPWLKVGIAAFHGAGIKVYGWRWPGVKPSDDPPNYYAPDQADYVARVLIPAGLDGYIADIESDGPSAPGRDWNSRSLAPLAAVFQHHQDGRSGAEQQISVWDHVGLRFSNGLSTHSVGRIFGLF